MKNVDRRKFIATSVSAVPAIALPFHFLPAKTTQQPSVFQRFVSTERHVEQFGEYQTLSDLRNDFFPIPVQRFGILGDDFRYRQPRHERLAEYLAEWYDMHIHESHWAKLVEQPKGQFWRTMLLTVPRDLPIRDWWLYVSHTAKTDIRISVIRVTSDRSIDNLSLFFRLTERIDQNIDEQHQQIVSAMSSWRRLVQVVNQRITKAMESISI